MPSSAEPFLSGNFAPVSDEAIIVGLAVDGVLPAALNGTFLRHGPNPIGTPPPDYVPADGDGMVHAVTLRAGRAVVYKNRWVRTAAAAAKLGVEPPSGPPQPTQDRSNHSLVAIGGRALSFGDESLPYDLTVDLDTIARTDLGGTIQAGVAPHAKVDPVGGAVVTVPARVPGARSSFVHDFGLTREHVVAYDGGRVGVFDRGDMAARWFDVDSDAGTVDHVVNAYESGGDLLVDVITGGRLERWTITDRVEREVLDHAPQGAPRINDHFVAAPYRYSYTVALDEDGRTPASRLLKHDLATRAREVHDFGPDIHVGEHVFVADPARRDAEDGGWLVGFIHHDTARDARLIVLDAQHAAGPPVASVLIPRRIPFGSHCAWIPTR